MDTKKGKSKHLKAKLPVLFFFLCLLSDVLLLLFPAFLLLFYLCLLPLQDLLDFFLRLGDYKDCTNNSWLRTVFASFQTINKILQVQGVSVSVYFFFLERNHRIHTVFFIMYTPAYAKEKKLRKGCAYSWSDI